MVYDSFVDTVTLLINFNTMKKIIKYLIYAVTAIVFLLIITLTYISTAFPNVGEAAEMEILSDNDKIARGKYLAWNVMMCADCHSQRDFSIFSAPPKPGTEFAGGDVFDQSMGFPGRFVSPNITPFGIKDWTDGELFRLITTGVKRDGEPIFPVMPYHSFGQLDAEDIESVIAYLRTLEPVETNHQKSVADFPMNLIIRTMPKEAQLSKRPPKDNSVAYGEYVLKAAACFDCHTSFDKGQFVGTPGGGGREFQFPDGSIIRTPNLTPHETGIKHFTKESFIQRFKQYSDSGFVLPKVKAGEFQTLMPWFMYSGMSREDLAAIFDYLQSLEPYENEVKRFEAPKPSLASN